jgi:hypothetical protein
MRLLPKTLVKAYHTDHNLPQHALKNAHGNMDILSSLSFRQLHLHARNRLALFLEILQFLWIAS